MQQLDQVSHELRDMRTDRERAREEAGKAAADAARARALLKDAESALAAARWGWL